MMIIDSSVWIALFNERDSQHDKAVSKSASFADVALPEYIFLETCTLLLSKAGRDVTEQFLAYVLDSADVAILHSSPEFFQATARLFRRPTNKKLSFVDVSLLVLAESHDIITFDKTLARAIESQRK